MITVFGENTRKYKTFSVPIEKEVKKINKDGHESVATISYRKNLLIVQDLWEVHYEALMIICKDCDCFLQYESVKDNLIKYNCWSCNRDCSNKLNEKFKKWFKNTFTFSNNNVNSFILLLRKSVYPYEYTNE